MKKMQKRFDTRTIEYTISLREKSTGKKIMEILLLYGEYPQNKLSILINKKPETIRKIVNRLEKEGYVEVNKIWNKEKTLRLTHRSRQYYGIPLGYNGVTDGRRDVMKLARADRISETAMMFDESELTPRSLDNGYIEIKEIRDALALGDDEKAISSTRMNGLYNHYNRHYAVYNINKGMHWHNASENATRICLRMIMKIETGGAILFIDGLMNGLKLFTNETKKSLSVTNTCYDNMNLIPIDRDGIEQLRLLREFKNVQEEYIKIVFNKNELGNTLSNEIDGTIDEMNTAVMFNCDVMRLDRLKRMFHMKLIKNLMIVCFDFQVEFYLQAMEGYPNIVVVAHSIESVKEGLGIRT